MTFAEHIHVPQRMNYFIWALHENDELYAQLHYAYLGVKFSKSSVDSLIHVQQCVLVNPFSLKHDLLTFPLSPPSGQYFQLHKIYTDSNFKGQITMKVTE